ncbi:ATP-binding protein [Streptomyces sp. NPDC049099]|uniref:ATP-binding protein n=1 Tax=Streptomyces sp. NPDC049099 TaxID=3155768 RepID=UPI003425AEDE
MGDSGTDTSHLLIVLGTAAAWAGYRVRCTTAAALVSELVEAAKTFNWARPSPATDASDLLEIDELGYLELDRRARKCSSRLSLSVRKRAVLRSLPTRLSPALSHIAWLAPQPRRA